MADTEDKALVLYRGSLERVVVPFSWFRSASRNTKPNFNDFEVIDNGQTVRLGKYEAAVDAILYEFDPEARARLKDNLVQRDTSFGGALRRLRLQRGVSRDDFSGIAPKTIAPHRTGGSGESLRPGRLSGSPRSSGVEPDEIETF